jgi:hypothetical protein
MRVNRIIKLAVVGVIALGPLVVAGATGGGSALASTNPAVARPAIAKSAAAFKTMAGLHFVPVRTITVHRPGDASPSVTLGYFQNYGGLCLDANSNDYNNNGDSIQLWTCADNARQLWYVSGDNIVNDGGKCLDANSNDYANNGDPIQLWSCDTNPEQLWYTLTSPPGNIYNDSGLCLDANSNDYNNNGDPIQLWSCDSNPEQIWY